MFNMIQISRTLDTQPLSNVKWYHTAVEHTVDAIAASLPGGHRYGDRSEAGSCAASALSLKEI